jgi:uncharacterized protein (DUF3084 family)
MFARLAELRLVRSPRIGPRPREAITHCNDNLPALRRPPEAGKRRSPTPVLACHWFNRGERLECRWQAETSDVPTGAFDEHRADHACGRLSMLPRGCGLALTG